MPRTPSGSAPIPAPPPKKLDVARWVTELGLPLTVNAPIHRQNIHNVGRYIELAIKLGAQRLEIAHVQYYGWAYLNRAALIPTYDQTSKSIELVERERERLKGVLTIDMVVPDYYAKRPKPCMGGWGKGFMNITPAGKVLPCHAAETIKTLTFDNVQDRPLLDIWLNSDAFNAFRGTDWMKEPCRSCAFREIDFGGCRCQAMAITGDARNTDPACALSPYHGEMVRLAREEAAKPPTPFVYRNPRNAAEAAEGRAPAGARGIARPLLSLSFEIAAALRIKPRASHRPAASRTAAQARDRHDVRRARRPGSRPEGRPRERAGRAD